MMVIVLPSGSRWRTTDGRMDAHTTRAASKSAVGATARICSMATGLFLRGWPAQSTCPEKLEHALHEQRRGARVVRRQA
jgi:hypothetical protein